MNLTGRLVLLLVLALVTITGAFDYVRLVRERERLVELVRTDQRIFAETLALAVRRNVRRGRTTEELQELLGEIKARPGLVWAVIYDPRGQAVAASVGARAAPAAADTAVISTLRSRVPLADLAPGVRGREVRYVQPFPWPDGRVAAVEVRQSLEAVEREFARALREGITSRVIVVLCFVVATVVLTRFSIAKPIRALIGAARAVGAGDLRQRIVVRHRDEIGQLALEFNRMAESLELSQLAVAEESARRLALEREVQQAQKLVAVGMLAAQVAHELGTPLNVIAGRAESLARRLPADHPHRRPLETIQAQADRIANIVRDLLDYARPRRPTLRAEQIAPLLARVANVVDARDANRGVRIGIDMGPAVPAVLGDADQLQQVFINLFTNAVDASPAGGVVRVVEGPGALLPAEDRAGVVRGRAEAPTVSIHVLDEGPGLGADELARIFQPFFSTKRGRGTGLGLPIVEEIVRAHRGEVEMLSVAGRGTEVIVRLPVAPSPAEAALAAPHAP